MVELFDINIAGEAEGLFPIRLQISENMDLFENGALTTAVKSGFDHAFLSGRDGLFGFFRNGATARGGSIFNHEGFIACIAKAPSDVDGFIGFELS